jgi:hypothetical protein
MEDRERGSAGVALCPVGTRLRNHASVFAALNPIESFYSGDCHKFAKPEAGLTVKKSQQPMENNSRLLADEDEDEDLLTFVGQPAASQFGSARINGPAAFLDVNDFPFFVDHERGPVRNPNLGDQNSVGLSDFPF